MVATTTTEFSVERYTKQEIKRRDRREIPFQDKVLFQNGDIQKCDKCDYHSPKYTDMWTHKATKHSESKYKCSECNFSHYFPNRVKIHHNQVHLGIKRSRGPGGHCQTEHCKYYGTENCPNSLLHEKMFLCDQCNYSATRKGNLKIHIQHDHEGIVFPCTKCTFSAERLSSLKWHTRTLHEDNKFHCDQCDYTAREKWHIKKHSLTKHEGLMRYKCEYMNCSYGTDLRRTLKYHIIYKHTNGKTLRCEHCGKLYTTFKILKLHMKSKHQAFTNNNEKDKNKSEKVVNKIFLLKENQRKQKLDKKSNHKTSLIKANHTNIMKSSPEPSPSDPFLERQSQEAFPGLCTQPSCDFLAQSLNEGQEHLNLAHGQIVFKTNSFIRVSVEMAEALDIIKEINKVQKEINET